MNDVIKLIVVVLLVGWVAQSVLMAVHPEETLESLRPLLIAVGGTTGGCWGFYQYQEAKENKE